MASKPPTTFPLFPLLPLPIRLRIWNHASNAPRVVGIHEQHISRPGFGHLSLDTCLISSTRPPALLSVSHEARTVALSIYSRIDEGISKVVGGRPVWVNGKKDVLYRGKKAAGVGGAEWWAVCCRDWARRRIPICGAGRLAVDEGVLGGCWDLRGEEAGRKREGMVMEVRECVERGVREIWLVTGNDDQGSEIELLDLPNNVNLLTPKQKTLVGRTERFKDEIKLFWETNGVVVALPRVKVMTPRRKPLSHFSKFGDLPIELQDLIWGFAGRARESVITLTNEEADSNQLSVKGVHIPALLHACRGSRDVMRKLVVWETIARRNVPVVRGLDVVRLETRGGRYSPIIFGAMRGVGVENKGVLKDVGLVWGEGRALLSSRDFRVYFEKVERVVVLVGRGKGGCVVEMMEVGCAKGLGFWEIMELERAREYALGLRKSLEERWGRWVEGGRRGNEWMVPRIEVKLMRPVTEIWNPYSY